MNILYFFPEVNSYMGQWQKFHIFDELQKHGHIIHLFNPLIFSTMEEANEALVQYIKRNKQFIDLFMNANGSDQLYPETVREIKRMEIKTLLICFDNLHAPFMHKTIAPHFDLVWLTSKENHERFKHWGSNIVFMPYAANPNVFKPQYDKEISAIGFIGSAYGTRINKINNFLNNHIKCQIYSQSLDENNNNTVRYSFLNSLKSGLNLMRFSIGRQLILGALKRKYVTNIETSFVNSLDLEIKPSVSFEEMIHLYSNLAISLGITELRNTYTLKKPIHKLHLRTFEIPMCGGLQLSSYTEELSEYFEEDKEIILYKSDEEMISKAKFYLKPENKKLRENMKLKARLRAEGEHTWIHRFNIIFKLLSFQKYFIFPFFNILFLYCGR
jgi:spore maturation protein CgeB